MVALALGGIGTIHPSISRRGKAGAHPATVLIHPNFLAKQCGTARRSAAPRAADCFFATTGYSLKRHPTTIHQDKEVKLQQVDLTILVWLS